MIMLRTAGDILSGSLFISSVRFPLAYEFLLYRRSIRATSLVELA